MVELETPGASLGIEVFFLDAQDRCVEYKATDCDQTVTTANQDIRICELGAPEDREYWVHYTNLGDETLSYRSWTPDA